MKTYLLKIPSIPRDLEHTKISSLKSYRDILNFISLANSYYKQLLENNISDFEVSDNCFCNL